MPRSNQMPCIICGNYHENDKDNLFSQDLGCIADHHAGRILCGSCFLVILQETFISGTLDHALGGTLTFYPGFWNSEK